MIIPDKTDVPFRFIVLFNDQGEEYPDPSSVQAGFYLPSFKPVHFAPGQVRDVYTGIRLWTPRDVVYTISTPESHLDGVSVIGHSLNMENDEEMLTMYSVSVRLRNDTDEGVLIKEGDVIGNLTFIYHKSEAAWRHVFIWPSEMRREEGILK
jgi:hypothetical protein